MSEQTRRTDSERIAVIESVCISLRDRLVGAEGNGGELLSLHKRISKLENWRWWVMGIAVACGILVGGAGKSIAQALLGK